MPPQKRPASTGMAEFEALLNAQLAGYRAGFDPGERVRGTVLSADGAYVVLDVQAKREGLVPADEFRGADGALAVAPGDRVDVYFVGPQEGAFVFSARLTGATAAGRSIGQAHEAGLPVEGIVTGEVNGGYEVDVSGVRAFCPFSQIDLFRTEGAVYVGQRLTFLVAEYGEDGRNVVLSRRSLLEREREEQREALARELAPGQIRRGTVTRLAEFGVFVDLGGAEGLVPLRELSWQRDTKPADVVRPGDTVEVLVREIDWEQNRISLSLRGTQRDPWQDALLRYPPGSVLSGKVTRIERFGAFVELMPGVEGLLPIGRLAAGRRLMSPREAVSEGQELDLQVESVDAARRRISLRPIEARGPGSQPGAPGADAEADDDPQQYLARHRGPAGGLGSLGDALSGLKL